MTTGIPALLDSVVINLFAALADHQLDTALDAYTLLADSYLDGHHPTALAAMSSESYQTWLLAIQDMLTAMASTK